jgi:multicomponent Na+:H+ antiporter subunit C
VIWGLYNYWIAIVLMMIGFYGVIGRKNLVKQAIALGLFQTGVFLFYLSMGVKEGGGPPVWTAWTDPQGVKHADIKNVEIPLPGQSGPPVDNPLNHILILTAIVVSVSTLAVALAIIVNIKRAYGTVEEDEILALDAASGNERIGAGAAGR